MKLYADLPARRARQLFGDALLAAWVVVWVQLGLVVREATLALAEPGRQIESAGRGLADRLRDAGETVAQVPLVGDEARAPFSGAGDAAGAIADAGAAQVEAVQTLAFWLAVAVAGIPVVLAVLAYLPLRWRFVRAATAAGRLVESTRDPEALLALRALAHQPVHRLATVSDDAAGGWRRGDPDVVRDLAAMELRDLGLAASPRAAP